MTVPSTGRPGSVIPQPTTSTNSTAAPNDAAAPTSAAAVF